MLIEGSISSKKTKMLVEEYARLLNSGISSADILVLVNNSTAKENFINKTFELLNIDCVEKMQVYSFFGLVYNTVMDNWAFLENKLSNGNPVVIPNMIGLEISQFMLKDIIKDIKFEGYNSKKSLLQQLFRRYSLIIQNNLNEKEVDWRSNDVLKEGFSNDAKSALKTLMAKTLNYRSFDYLRQSLLFNYIYKNTEVFKNIKYLLIDDADEITPICFDFISYLKPQLQNCLIACDRHGSSRSGYLSADKNIYLKLTELFANEIEKLDTQSPLAEDADVLYRNVIQNEVSRLEHFSFLSPSKRATMIDLAVLKVEDLLRQGYKPSDIVIISPIIDDMLRFCLKEKVQNANLLFLSGSEKLVQNPYVLASLTILKLNTNLKDTLSEFDLRVILSNILDIPIRHCQVILSQFEKTKKLVDYEFKIEEYNEKYTKFRNLVEELKNSKKTISEQVLYIFNNLFKFYSVNKNTINKFTFFVKELQDFETVFSPDFMENKLEDIITQIETSVIAENPYSTFEIDENDLVIATPQKIIDNQIQTKFQLWLDISSSEWIKNDIGPLYNSWVFQADWSKGDYTVQDDVELSRQKTARILRKLTLCASQFIYTFSSLFDGTGAENFGGIEQYFRNEEIKTSNSNFKIIPREDQKPVLDYKQGQMAISAVPGAGKTTTIRMLLGIIKKDSGEITWKGKEVDRENVNFGYLPEERGVYPKTKIFDQLMYFAELKGMNKVDAIKSINKWAKELKVEEYLQMPAEKLSKGNQQKIQFMNAIIHNPELVVLDEPFSGLDPVNTEILKNIIIDLIKNGKYVIMSAHQMATIEEFCSDILILNKGKTVLQGNLKQIKETYPANRVEIDVKQDIDTYIKEFNLEIENVANYNYVIKINDEGTAHKLLNKLITEGIKVDKFEIKKPTLNDIFIEKVGE